MRSSSSEPAGQRAAAEGEPPRLTRSLDAAGVEPRIVRSDGAHPHRDCVGARPQLVHAPPALARRRPSAFPGTATRPSSVTATFQVTNGLPSVTHVRQASFCARAAKESTSSTSTPASRSRSTPPAASGFGSREPTTTFATPAATIASVHGGVDPWCAQGSIVTYSVAPLAALAGRVERDDLAVATIGFGRALADHVPVAHEHRADVGLRVGPAQGRVGERERPLQVVRHAGNRRRATKKPDVPWTCGSVSRNSGRVGWRKAGQSAPRSSTARPEASTTASFSSAFSVQTE